MLEQSSWYEHYRLGSNDGQSLNFAPNINTKLGVYFGWRWISWDFLFDIKDLIGKGKEKAPQKRDCVQLIQRQIWCRLVLSENRQ